MDNEIQTEDKRKPDEKVSVEESLEKPLENPESGTQQTVTRERIERVKKAFRPTWLVRELNLHDNNKGK